MDDLISKTDVIKIIKSVLSPVSSLANVARARRQMLTEIDELESKPEPHWIPVEQESPKIGEYVLCQTTPHFFKTMHCFNNYHVCQFVDKDKWIDKPHFDWDRDGFPHVIAWTRFEPYKGVTE